MGKGNFTQELNLGWITTAVLHCDEDFWWWSNMASLSVFLLPFKSLKDSDERGWDEKSEVVSQVFLSSSIVSMEADEDKSVWERSSNQISIPSQGHCLEMAGYILIGWGQALPKNMQCACKSLLQLHMLLAFVAENIDSNFIIKFLTRSQLYFLW